MGHRVIFVIFCCKAGVSYGVASIENGEFGLGHGLAVRPVAVEGFQFGDFG